MKIRQAEKILDRRARYSAEQIRIAGVAVRKAARRAEKVRRRFVLSGDVFDKFYRAASLFAGPGTPLDAIRVRGAIWYQRTTGRALLMTGVSQFRLGPNGASALIASYLANGHVKKDACPLDEVTDIYVATEAA